jgi:hypothetical protein
MNKIILCLFIALNARVCFGQYAGAGINGRTVTSRVTVIKWETKPEVDETNIHEKFLKEEWTPAQIKFRSGRPDMEVPVLFNPVTNQLNFIYGDLIMEFVDSVSEFTMKVPYKTDSVLIRYKRFYPAIGSNTSATFYRVLVVGNFSLLKYPVPSEKRKKIRDQDYVYYASLPGNRIVQFKPGLENILAALPEYKEQIKAIIAKHKIKPNDEDQLISLFVHFNNEIKVVKEEKPKRAF